MDAPGLVIPVHAGLKGRVRWQVLDERGVPEIPRTPSGVAIASADGVEQDNLILDAMMDRLVTQDVFNTTASAARLRGYLAVGTGSTAPTTADTALVAEVQRAASSGGYSAGSTSYSSASPPLFRATSVVNRVITMTADRNLTEFALCSESTGNLNIRELFRDEFDTPITISLLTGKQILVTHTLYVDLDMPTLGTASTINIEEYDATDTLDATIAYNITRGWVRGNQGGAWPFNVWNPQYGAANLGIKRVTGGGLTFGAETLYFGNGNINLTSLATPTRDTYVNGTYQRMLRATVAAGTGTGLWYGFMFAGSASNQTYGAEGYMVLFDSPTSYDKVSIDELRLALLMSWARV